MIHLESAYSESFFSSPFWNCAGVIPNSSLNRLMK